MYKDQPAAIQADPPASGLRERLNRGMLSVRPTSKFSPHMLMGEMSHQIIHSLVTKQADNTVYPLNSSCKLCQRTKPKKKHSTFSRFFFVSTKRNSTLFMNPFMHIPKVKILKLHTMLQCPSFRMPWMMWIDFCTAVSECHHVLIPYLDTRGSWPPASIMSPYPPGLLLSPIVPASVSASLLSSTDISDHQQHLFCINSLTF